MEIQLRKVFGYNLDEIKQIITGKKYTKHIISLNTKDGYFTDGIKKIKWDYFPNSNIFDNGFTSFKHIKNIIGIKISNIISGNPEKLHDNYYHTLTVTIDELVNQSFKTSGDSNGFHFIFANRINLTNINESTKIFTLLNDDVFWFNEPMTSMESLTLSFGNPIHQVELPVQIISVHCSEFSTTNPTIITFPRSHELITGDKIYINNFTTDNKAVDNEKIALINDMKGHVITKIDSTKLSIPVDLLSITPATPSDYFCSISSDRYYLEFTLEIFCL